MVNINAMPGYAVVPLAEANLDAPLTKVLDTYVHVAAARSLIFAPAIEEFLRAIFEEGALAFQGLHFEKGSTQAIHQDTAYVVCEEPMKLCASWIALQDVVPGSGELYYYRGSHRLPDWVYSGEHKEYNGERDTHAEHLAHIQSLHDRSKERGLPLERFLPRKGDALIWAADLAHGGSPITDQSLRRRSLVTHYTPESCAPHWFRTLPPERQVRTNVRPGCSYCTSYY
jgi:ectoine hydroxylase-related dioxygenase (phytanoyl-CoA dioxygenase family)